MTEVPNKIIRNLVGLAPYTITYNRANELYAYTVTADSVQVYDNSNLLINNPMPGFWGVSNMLNGASAPWKYVSFTLGAAPTVDEATGRILTVTAADYEKYQRGAYHMDQTTGEVFYVSGKSMNADSTVFTVYAMRGLLGTTQKTIGADTIYVLNQFLLDSGTAGTKGIYTITISKAFVANDVLVVVGGGLSAVYTWKAVASAPNELPVGANIAAQVASLTTAITRDFPVYTSVGNSTKVTMTEVNPSTAGLPIVNVTGTGVAAAAQTTAAVASNYDVGFGVINGYLMPEPGVGQLIQIN